MVKSDLRSRREFYWIISAFIGGTGAAPVGRRVLSSYHGANIDPSTDALYRARLESFRACPGHRDLVLLGDSHIDFG